MLAAGDNSSQLIYVNFGSPSNLPGPTYKRQTYSLTIMLIIVLTQMHQLVEAANKQMNKKTNNRYSIKVLCY